MFFLLKMGLIVESVIKYYVKMWIVYPARSFLLYFFAKLPNHKRWGDRMLIINLLSLGDLVIFTSVLKHYKKQFPDKNITLLIKFGTGLEEFLQPFVNNIITIHYDRFAVNPFYGFRIISLLRHIGFRMVVDQNFSSSEVQGKIIATSLGSEEIIGSDGFALECDKPFDFQQAKNLQIVSRYLLPRYTTIIPTRDLKSDNVRLLSVMRYYASIFERISRTQINDYAPILFVSLDVDTVLKKFGLLDKKYVIMNISASQYYKRWPIDRFISVAQAFVDRDIIPVIVGMKTDRALCEAFCSSVSLGINLAGLTSILELMTLIASSYMVFTNDTSTVHMAVALRRPSLCIIGGGHFGMLSMYGYLDINRWVYARTDCFYDNWRCSRNLSARAISPCMDAITIEIVRVELIKLLDYIDASIFQKIPREPFRVECNSFQ